MQMKNQEAFAIPNQQSAAVAARITHLIENPVQRKARAEEKRAKILRLLRDEIWTVTEVIARLLGVGYPAAHAALKAMVRDGLITSAPLHIPSRRGTSRVILHGITAQGLAYAWGLDETPLPRNPWEPSKTNALFVPHQIAIQLARGDAEEAGWREWKPARALMGQGLPKLPDAEAIDPEGNAVAIELEREIKTDKRYEAVIGAYISVIKQENRWSRIDYICPDADFAGRLARVFGRLKQLRLETRGGQPAKVGQLQPVHLGRFRFYAVGDWPNGKFIQPFMREFTGQL
ncbi:glucose-1-phosphate thymidylyltransferase [Novimethylophilus kurashikiensis]|uniref:Glucose-1-phosphate thymidylyltransferase n=2 Tax=Novimethylophilus kurashikiensis TaxID=1825523 RepID=A0A2R5F6M3_9PROT|nr:glucose-1-phosphate thymidylyltransferase [Novimethylophilus kurashikiensis]